MFCTGEKEWGSYDDNVRKSYMVYNSRSPNSESVPSTSFSNSTRGNVGRQKRLLESDHSCRVRQPDHQHSDFELLSVDGSGREVSSTSCLEGSTSFGRFSFKLSLTLGIVRLIVRKTLAITDKGALPARGYQEGSYTHSINHFHPLANSFFVDVDGEKELRGDV